MDEQHPTLSAILEIISSNLDQPPTSASQAELIELLTRDPKTRDLWIAEVQLDEALRSHFEASQHLQIHERLLELAQSESGRRVAKRSSLKRVVIAGGLVASIFFLVGIVLPAVRASRSASNLRKIGKAMIDFRDIRQPMLEAPLHSAEVPDRSIAPRVTYPAAYSVNESGMPLLSWRVAILPYLDEMALYEKFHLDEPWDSPHNLKLVDQIPTIYQSSSPMKLGYTTYLAVTIDTGLIRSPSERHWAFGNVLSLPPGVASDGVSGKALVVEVPASLAVPWTCPRDYPVRQDAHVASSPAKVQALEVWNSKGRVICDRVVLADGTVREVSNGISKSMITLTDEGSGASR